MKILWDIVLYENKLYKGDGYMNVTSFLYMQLFTDIGFDWKDICIVFFVRKNARLSIKKPYSCFDFYWSSSFSGKWCCYLFDLVGNVFGECYKMPWGRLFPIVSKSDFGAKVKYHDDIGINFFKNIKICSQSKHILIVY